MLADECLNPECYGVPLVRPPKPGGGKDPRKVGSRSPLRMERQFITITQECVICGSVYVDEEDLGDLDHSITQPRAIPTEGYVENDKDVEKLHLPKPTELKSNVTIPPTTIRLTVRSGLFHSLK